MFFHHQHNDLHCWNLDSFVNITWQLLCVKGQCEYLQLHLLIKSDLDPQIIFHTFIQSLAQFMLHPQQILQCPTLYRSHPTDSLVYFLNVKAWALIIDNEWMVHQTWIATVILWSCLCTPVNLGVVFLTAIVPCRVSQGKVLSGEKSDYEQIKDLSWIRLLGAKESCPE